MEHAPRIALIEAGSPGLNIYSHVAMGRGVPMLATVVDHAGYEVRAFVEDISGKQSIDWEWVAGCDVVGFSAITCTLTRTAELTARAREVSPRAIVLLGGPEPTCAPQRAFEAGADLVIRGEAEKSLVRFLRELQAEEDLTDVPGIVWRERGGLKFGPDPVQLTREEVCELPIIDMSLVHGAELRTTGLVWRSRGCPARCSFCEVHEIWPKYVLRDEKKSAEELMLCQAQADGGTFLIDDNSAANKPSFKRFLAQAIASGYARPLAIQLRADAAFDRKGRLDRELLRLLRDVAPVTMLCIGVESAEDEDLDSVGKQEDSERMRSALRAFRRYGLLVHGMFIAFADDTLETLRKNGRFARRYVTSLQYLFETPLPGTSRTAEHEAAGRLLFKDLRELKFNDGMHVALRPDKVSARQMQETVIAEYRRFYSKMRLARAFISGFLRHRKLGRGQVSYLKTLPFPRRVRQWFWLHLQFRFAPWAMLRIGRRRVLEFLSDAEYTEYLRRLPG